MEKLGNYVLSGEVNWKDALEKAEMDNAWFTREFLELAVENIAEFFLNRKKLENWISEYGIKEGNPRLVGIVMAGNIPLVGFHDFLCVFISGHRALLKASSKDKVLIRHLTDKLIEWEPCLQGYISYSEMLKGCDAYIATGSNNSSRYFEYYFGKYPHIIRRNRTSVAILDGNESAGDLEKLADDVYSFFGLGCRNVTKIYVPTGYDFLPLLEAFKKYNYLADHHKFKNNYDYNLAIHILNKKYYMTNGSILLAEESSLFSPISQLNYEFYNDLSKLELELGHHPDLQCLAGKGHITFGRAQYPSLNDYADGLDTMAFLTGLS
jgi:hypothetical protein